MTADSPPTGRTPATTPAGHRSADAPPVVGVIGGVGSGKSAVARTLAEAIGAVLIDGDVVGHETLADPAVAAEVAAAFEDVTDDADAVDRRKLGRVVFADSAAMDRLEAILHPRMRRRFVRDIAAARDAGRPVVFDAAVMFEAGWDDLCDVVAFVDVPEDVREARAVGRGWTADRWRAAEQSQWPLGRKRDAATFAVSNADADHGASAAAAIADRLQALAGG